MGEPRFCSKHAGDKPGMDDVVRKQCEHEDCTTKPSYGHPGHPTSRCAVHKTSGMIPHSNRRCTVPRCRETAVFGTMTRQLHCEKHAVEGEINLVEQSCKSCGLLNVLSPTSLMCGYCDKYFTQRRPVKRKELDVKGCLEAAGYSFVHNQAVVKAGGLMERPDFVIYTGPVLIFLECDEHQHSQGAYQCQV
jgi:hypothetical protein